MTPFNYVFSAAAFVIACGSLVMCETCDQYGVLFYEEINCDPVKSDTETCPSQYQCDFTRSKSGCEFQGKNFIPGENIPANLTYSGCSIGCTCEDFDFIRCAKLDCPEDLEAPPEAHCYHEYELGKCCSIGQKCNVTDESKKCEVDGIIYEIGQTFYPKNTCFSCVCHENFTGEYDKGTCMRLNCVSQIYHTEEIKKKCAPTYFNFHSEEVLCCPDTFVCPDPSDDIKTVNHEVDRNSSLECYYGEDSLLLGEGFHREVNKYGKNRNLLCECILPPLLTCKEV